MKKLIFSTLLLSLVILSCKNTDKPDIVSSLDVDQSKNNFFMNEEGEILDSSSYKSQRKSRLGKLKEVSSSFRLYEKLEKQYNRNDSVVYAYKWFFSDMLEETIEEDKKKSQNIGKVYPISNAKTLDGRTINIADLKGKPTLINLWFTKCAPCIEEMPALNELKSRYNTRFNFLSVTTDGAKTVQKFLENTRFDFPHIVDSKELTTDLGFNGFPVNLFLDKEGVLQIIKGNVPYVKNAEGKMVVSDGKEFIEILKGME